MWTDDDFNGLSDGGPEHDWSITSIGNPEDVSTALPTYKQKFMPTLNNKGPVVYKLPCNLLRVELSDQKTAVAWHKKLL